MNIYILGPMRGVPFYNFPAFDRAAQQIYENGHTPFSPADMDRAVGFDAMKLPANTDWDKIPDGFDFDACISRDLQAIRLCDAVVRLPGWQNSVGARAENALAEWLGKQIYLPESNEAVPHIDLSIAPNKEPAVMRTFASGATRDSDLNKIDFDGFLSIPVVRAFGEYMHKHRKQADGQMRASDNWKKGIDREAYRKSAWRHFFDWVDAHIAGDDAKLVDSAMALLFNIQGDAHEVLKKHNALR